MHGEPYGPHRYAPDGLAGEALDELINQAYAEAAKAPRLTSALLDGSAAEQRRSRMQRRALAAVVRSLPVRRGASVPHERESGRSGVASHGPWRVLALASEQLAPPELRPVAGDAA